MVPFTADMSFIHTKKRQESDPLFLLLEPPVLDHGLAVLCQLVALIFAGGQVVTEFFLYLDEPDL